MTDNQKELIPRREILLRAPKRWAKLQVALGSVFCDKMGQCVHGLFAGFAAIGRLTKL
jgi:hypothetical protein